MPRNPTLLALP
jgi:hypothetical protein